MYVYIICILYTILYILYYTILYYTILYYTILYYTILYYRECISTVLLCVKAVMKCCWCICIVTIWLHCCSDIVDCYVVIPVFSIIPTMFCKVVLCVVALLRYWNGMESTRESIASVTHRPTWKQPLCS